MKTALFNVTGMTCGGCTSKVSLSAGEATVHYDERLTSPDKLISAVQLAGYSGECRQPSSQASWQGWLLRLTRVSSAQQ
jgi:copper chaperone